MLKNEKKFLTCSKILQMKYLSDFLSLFVKNVKKSMSSD